MSAFRQLSKTRTTPHISPQMRGMTQGRTTAESHRLGRERGLVLCASIAVITLAAHTLTIPLQLDSNSSSVHATSQSTVPDAPQKDGNLVSYSELQKHTDSSRPWVLIDGKVYDVSHILDTHPGGRSPLIKNAGRDATKSFAPIHPPGTLDSLPPEAYIGSIDPATVPRSSQEPTEEEKRIEKARAALPSPSAVLNLREIEGLAETVLSATAWGYYRSAGDDEKTFDENREAFSRFWFRPRVLNKISRVSTATSMAGLSTTLPIFIAPAALARLGHPDGEMNLVRAAGKAGILQGISSNASCSIDEILTAKAPEQKLIFQLYVNKDRAASEALVKRLAKEGFAALMFTVDAAVPGKRELDQRSKGEFAGPSHGKSATGSGAGVAHAIGGYQDPDICWKDISWIRTLTDIPLIIKGIQCVEDVEIAFDKYNVQGVILSNHGGRELDFSPAPMEVLYELRQRRPDLLKKHEVYIDGGVTRGTDVLKALCLGARGVGLGRAFLYANSVWGEEGCSRVIQILREEIVTGMQLLGVTSIEQLTPDLVRYVDRLKPMARSRL